LPFREPLSTPRTELGSTTRTSPWRVSIAHYFDAVDCFFEPVSEFGQVILGIRRFSSKADKWWIEKPIIGLGNSALVNVADASKLKVKFFIAK
jgi:hypothetical protein